MAKNISKIYLLNVPLENDYLNTLYFANATAQQTYFQSKVVKSYTDFSYQRKDHVIRIPEEYDAIYNVNYVMYQNTAYSNKWFYAFITDLKYVNDGMTEATIETDVIQTWLFDYTVKSSFVEREHVNNDAVGVNTVPENLETGDYISCNLQPSEQVKKDSTTCCFVIAVSDLKLGLSYATFQAVVPMGLYYVGCTTQQGIRDFIKAYDTLGAGDAITAVFVAPSDFFTSWTTITYSGNTFNGQFSTTLSYEASETIEITKAGYIGNNYVPRNNKLLTYPFTYLQVSNNNGTIVNYHWENFNLLSVASDGKIKFHIAGTITPGCSYRAYPLNYNNILNDFDDGLTLGKLPIGSWNSDVYTNWLTQNGVNNVLNVVSSAGQIAGGIGMMASGVGALAGAGMVGSGILGVAGTIGKVYEHSLIPDQVGGNASCGDVNYQYGLINLTFKCMSIKNEYASIIDGYFDMFGYKVNKVKVPNTNHRAKWWYTKTIDVSIDGNIPDSDIQKIKNCYNSGIRFWRNASEIENYSLANGIV